MATVTLQGQPVHTSGELPPVGSEAPDFRLVDKDLIEHTLSDYSGLRKVVSIVSSLDTPVGAAQARRFNEEAPSLGDTVVLVISDDLPFAQLRFCAAEDIGGFIALSTMGTPDFARDYGVLIEDGPLAGICARAVLVLDADDTVRHAQLVPEITDEPDYEAALAALR